MSNITRDYALELASLYGIEINEDSSEHLIEGINGEISQLKRADIPDLFGIDFDVTLKMLCLTHSIF